MSDGAPDHSDDKELHVPRMSRDETREAKKLKSSGAKILHESIREEGEEELRRTSSALAWSGWAAGLSMGFCLLTEGALQASLPPEKWTEPIAKLGFPTGFLIVILGRQQLFTENTLTPIIPLLARRDRKTLFSVLRLWSIVLMANLLGAAIVAWALTSSIFPVDVQDTFAKISEHAIRQGFLPTLLKGIFAGWLLALIVWILGGMKNRGAYVIFALTYAMSIAGFIHVITGSVDAFYLVFSSKANFVDYVAFLIPTLLGNIIGGVALVSIANHAQVVAGGGTRD